MLRHYLLGGRGEQSAKSWYERGDKYRLAQHSGRDQSRAHGNRWCHPLSSPTAPPEPVTSSPPKPEAQEKPASVTPTLSSAPPSGPSMALKDVSTFPVTVNVTQRLEVKTDSGGFGLDPGDELLVLRKHGNMYIISHENQEFPIDTSLLDNMQAK